MAYNFGGGSNEGISYGYVPAFANLTRMIISMIIRVKSTAQGWQSYVNHVAPGNNNGFSLGHNGNGTPVDLHTFVRNNTQSFQDQSGALTINEWVHLLASFNGTLANPNRLQLFRNGVALTPSGLAGAQIFLSLDSVLRLGKWDNSSGNGARCDLAEIGIWTGIEATTQMIEDLASFKAPSFYDSNLHIYIPLINNPNDSKGNAGSAVVTGTTIVAHPNVTYPGGNGGGDGEPGSITWINLVNYQVLAPDVLTKTSGDENVPNAFARSEASFANDGEYIFVAHQANRWLRSGLGLIGQNMPLYLFDLGPGGRGNGHIPGVGWSPEFVYTTGDNFSIARAGTALRFYKNQTMVWEVLGQPHAGALVARAVGYGLNGAIRGAMLTGSGGGQPPPPPPPGDASTFMLLGIG